MLSGRKRILVLFCGALALLCTEGCRTRLRVQHSTLSTTIGNRTISASVDGAANITSINGNAEINFGNDKITINDSAVVANGKEIAKIPQQAKNITVDCTKRVLTVKADDQTIGSAKL